MNSADAREYVRLATIETKGLTKTACDLLIDESIKLSKIEQITNKWISLEDRPNFCMMEIREVLEKE